MHTARRSQPSIDPELRHCRLVNGNYAHGVTDLRALKGVKEVRAKERSRFSIILFNRYKRQQVADDNEARALWREDWRDSSFPCKDGCAPPPTPRPERSLEAKRRKM